MSIVVKMPSPCEPRERRLHLREVCEDACTESVGTVLRDRRVERGLDERAIAAKLKMRVDQLKAIEADDFERLPGRTYAVGFIRSYAKCLGLDPEALVEQYKLQTAATDLNQPVELIFPEVTVEYRRPNASLLIVALVVAVVIYGIAQITMPSRPTAVTVASAADSVIVVDAVPALKPVEAAAVAPAEVGVVNLNVPEPDAAQASDAAPLFTTLVHDFPVPLDGERIVIAAAAQVGESPVAASSRITLRALEATYVQIKDPGLRKRHAILLARVLNPGESFQAPDRAGLVLLTGNAGGIQVEVDGRSAGVLGKSGQVIKRLALEPAYFLSRIDSSR
ncbi:MAG: helix-turn-helix domain-containing protein [Alphaproteobacteria bacterium]|nr:helix-turn-helix domain-containing protein [Alphaproteobacteria bacterium]